MSILTHTHDAHLRSNRLSYELPMRLKEVRQIHDVNYTLILSSILITVALMALAWLVTASSTERLQMLDPMNGLAAGNSYAGSVTAVNSVHR